MEVNTRPSFHIGINMAGAISAGAYTAGVLDFLIEALDAWEAEKKEGKSVPRHNVIIDVLSGASAGGMCAAIAAVALHEDFPTFGRIKSDEQKKSNKLYNSWVQEADVGGLLGSTDLVNNGPALSLLDGNPVVRIANSLVDERRLARRRNYVAEHLAVFLTLTNLRGVPYAINQSNLGSFEESIAYYPDQIEFEMVANEGEIPRHGLAKTLPLTGNGSWDRLKQAAVASGSVPVALPARPLNRDLIDFDERQFTVRAEHPFKGDHCECDQDQVIRPTWGAQRPTDRIDTVNVDGGLTNNNPFELARKRLTEIAPSPGAHNPREAENADRAVVTIAPFPGDKKFDPDYSADEARKIPNVLVSIFGVLLSQSRFQGESLKLVASKDGFSRFVIAPRDSECFDRPALMGAPLGAFGGFIDQKFREHDFQLGRYNCQQFLKLHFVLPEGNKLFAGENSDVINKFRVDGLPKFSHKDGRLWLPIIPLCGTAALRIDRPPRNPADPDRLAIVACMATRRIRAVVPRLLAPNCWVGRTALRLLLWVFHWHIWCGVRKFLVMSLALNREPDNLAVNSADAGLGH